MPPTNSLLTCVVLMAGFVSSWDIAVTTVDQISFYSKDGTKTSSEGHQFSELTALAYDAVHNMLLFVDSQNHNISIFSLLLAGDKKYQPRVRWQEGDNIQGLAFDPVTNTLFWTDSGHRSIFWISLDKGSKDNGYRRVLIAMDDEVPTGIAVDSCRGYVYWTNIQPGKATIERARFDGSEREILINSDIYAPISIAIDQKEQRLYWADDKEGIHFDIESSDLNGKNRKVLYKGIHHQPNSLSVSEESVYWSDQVYKSIWRIPKNGSSEKNDLVKLVSYDGGKLPKGIIANVNLTNAIKGIPECQILEETIKNKTILSTNFKGPSTNRSLLCLHGEQVQGSMACQCSPGYKGAHCEISVCQNYCIRGDCTVNKDGLPECRCQPGFHGGRCQSDLCDNYCLNGGACSSSSAQPICQCPTQYQGHRCELPVHVETLEKNCNCSTDESSILSNEVPKTVASRDNETLSGFLGTDDGLFVESSCSNSWDFRDPVIMVLGCLSGVLSIACAILTTKILHLRKRPRIKKHIVVKNVTPLTARPSSQCEITIENCCNMNICETPCFEPRTIKPNLFEGKPSKEEKKNLISSMEHPDDLY